MKRDTPPGALRRACVQCGGLVGPDVSLLRQRCVCAASSRRAQTADVDGGSPGLCPMRGCSVSGGSRRRPGPTMPPKLITDTGLLFFEFIKNVIFVI